MKLMKPELDKICSGVMHRQFKNIISMSLLSKHYLPFACFMFVSACTAKFTFEREGFQAICYNISAF